MKELENNAHFWQKLDTMYLSNDFVLKNKKGDTYEYDQSLSYPCDFGFLQSNIQNKGEDVGCFKGDSHKELDGIAISADILAKTIKVYILVGCNEEKKEAILQFLNEIEFQKTILVKRTNQVASWFISQE